MDNRTEKEKIIVKSPATTANMGPGFDCIGMALNLFNFISFEIGCHPSIEIIGNGANELSRGPDNMVIRGFAVVFETLGVEVPKVSMICHNDIPLRRGLGSSAAAVAGGMVAANVLTGEKISLNELLRLADRIEGHPDNVAPALFGGCQIVLRSGGRLISRPIPVDSQLSAILLIPDLEIPTEKARKVMPSYLPIQDAIHNVGRAALLSMALTNGDEKALRIATQDAIHQPRRKQLFPAMTDIFSAALEAGACGAFLSGSGSTILAFAKSKEDFIAEAMFSEAARHGISSVTKVARPNSGGVSVVKTMEG